MRKIIALSALLALTAISSAVAAPPERPLATITKAQDVNVAVPQVAITNAGPIEIIPLGTAVDPKTGKIVEGIKIIHKRANAKPDGTPGNGPKDNNNGGGTCYAYLAKGAKWKTSEDYVVNPANGQGINHTDVLAAVVDNVAQWEDAADSQVDGSVSVDFAGSGSLTLDNLAAAENTMDNRNGVYFGNADSANTIAATTVWGIFGGPPSGRELVEWDMELNEVNFSWNTNGSADDMDLANIVTHELGHAFGMGHPGSECADETMYAFATEGETKKRDLNAGDIAGIDGLY